MNLAMLDDQVDMVVGQNSRELFDNTPHFNEGMRLYHVVTSPYNFFLPIKY